MVRIGRMRLVAVLVLATVMAAVVPASAAAVKRGSFAGATSADDPVSFKVDRRGRVVSFAFDAVELTCSDGDSVDTPRVVTPRRERFRVRRGRFGIEARNAETGFGWDADGRFRSKGRRATGTLTVFASFDEQNRQAANGSVKCESDALSWSVRRR